MAVRIAGVTIPNEKRVEISLTYIFGIGRQISNAILEKTQINPDIRVATKRRRGGKAASRPGCLRLGFEWAGRQTFPFVAPSLPRCPRNRLTGNGVGWSNPGGSGGADRGSPHDLTQYTRLPYCPLLARGRRAAVPAAPPPRRGCGLCAV